MVKYPAIRSSGISVRSIARWAAFRQSVTLFPERTFRHNDLEDRPFPKGTGLLNGDAGNREDLPGKEEPKTRVLPVSLSKIFFFSPGGIPTPLSANVMTSFFPFFRAPDSYGRHPLPVLHRIVKQVEKNPVNHRIGIDFEGFAGADELDPSGLTLRMTSPITNHDGACTPSSW